MLRSVSENISSQLQTIHVDIIHVVDFWKHFSERPLDAIFHPKSVAVIGASTKEGSVGRTILWNLLSSPFGGTIYPVNNRLKHSGNNGNCSNNIFGIRSYDNVKHLPERGIDLVIIAVPAKAVRDVSMICYNLLCIYFCNERSIASFLTYII